MEEATKLGSELGPGDDVDDDVVGVDERVEAVQHGEGILHDHVPLPCVVGEQETVARPADVSSEWNEVEQVVDELPVGQGEDDVQQRRGQQHRRRGDGTRRMLLLMLIMVVVMTN